MKEPDKQILKILEEGCNLLCINSPENCKCLKVKFGSMTVKVSNVLDCPLYQQFMMIKEALPEIPDMASEILKDFYSPVEIFIIIELLTNEYGRIENDVERKIKVFMMILDFVSIRDNDNDLSGIINKSKTIH